MFKRKNIQPSSSWTLSSNHPLLDESDTDPLPAEYGDKSSLPPSFQIPVSEAFIAKLKDTEHNRQCSELSWFNAKASASTRLYGLISFLGQCQVHEKVWIYVRFRELIFSISYATFVHEVDYLNLLPERVLSPSASIMDDLWTPFICVNRLIELMPRLVATGWKQLEIENMLIVLLDHGNNQDVRVFGFYTLTLYMVALNGTYSETTTDLFTNSLSLRAFSYVDMPEASKVAGGIMCVIASGISVPDIGCGQRSISGFKDGRASICPVLQDIKYPMNPQGILALRMLRNLLVLMSYLASLLPDPQAAHIEYYNLGLICYNIQPSKFSWQQFMAVYDIPHSAPLLAMSFLEIRSSLTSIYQLFRRSYLSWIYPSEEEAYRDRHIRRVPILGMHVFINFMLDNLVPRYPYMVIEKDFHMPRLGDNLEKCGTLDPRRGSDSESKIATGLETMSTRSYDILRHLMLDRDIKSAYFFTDILRLSLQILPSLESRGLDSDCIDKNELARVSYDICLGAMTVIRLWLTSKKEYRPVHLLPDEENEEILAGVISDYMGYIYRLLLWMVDKGDWNKRTLVLLYNGLQIHRAVMRLYRHHLPQDVKRGFMNSLQRIAVLFLKKPAKERRDEITMESFPNRALSIIVECLISGWMVLGDPVSSIALRFKELYMVPTVWTSHLNTWCNVLRALTIARGRHILKVEERTLIQESMFAGQRQRRGLNKVDEYLLNLKNPMYYLNDTTLRDGYETSTPFSITSNMTWDTMRLVFATTKVAANEEVAFAQACMQQCQSTETKLADPSSDYQSKALLKVTHAEDLGSAHMPTLDWEDAEDVDAQSDSMVSVHGDDAKSKLGPIGPAHFETSTRKLKSKNTASQIKSSGRVPSRSLQLNDIAEFNRHTFKSKMILYGLVRSWDVYRAVLDCSRYTPDNDDVLLNTSLWVAEMAAKFGIDDHRGRVAQTAIFRMGCRCSDHVNSRVLFLRSRFIQSALITLSPLSKGQPVNTDQVHMFLVECQLFLSLGISGSRMLLLSLERGLQRLFVDCNSFFGGYQEPAVKGAALLLVSMTTMLANSRVLATHKTTKFIRELTDSSLIDLKEDSKLTSLVSTLVCSKYPVIYNPQGIRQLTVEWEEGGLIFGRACDTLWRILLHSDGIHNYKSSGFVEQAALSGLSVVCLTELSIPDKSLQNRRLIKNCLACLASRLFSSRTDIDLMDFIGETETRRLAMDVMKAIIEHFDRASGEILTDNALVLRELLNLLLIILLKTPELIVRDSHMVDAGALAIRDFLIDQVIYRCVHPEIQVGSRAHKYNQELCSTNSEHGLVLFLNTANYSQRQSMSLGDFVLSTEDEQHFIGNPAESVKQMGEVLYITFMMQFDENNRLESLGEISNCNNDEDDAFIGPGTEDDFYSEQTFYYFHGNGIIKVCREPDVKFNRCVVRSCTGISSILIHFAPETVELPNSKCRQSPLDLSLGEDSLRHDASRIFVGEGYTEISAIKALTLEDVLNPVPELGEDSGLITPLSKKRISNETADSFAVSPDLERNVTAFLKREQEASSKANDFYSSSDDEDSSSDDSIISNTKVSSSETPIPVATSNSSAQIHERNPMSPLKMNLFRSQVQHNMGFDVKNANVNYFLPLKKTETLLRELKLLDSIHARENIKVAILYVGPGQWTEAEILSNTRQDTSLAYQSFVRSLGWPINLATFSGFIGKLERDGSDGKLCPYFSDEGIEVIFHEAALMPTNQEDIRQIKKKRHIGNDHVHIIWNESHHNYRPETISGDFGNVQIQIRPLEPGEYGIGLYCDDQVKPFGPLVNGMVVSADVLPDVVRAAAINGHRHASQVFFKTFMHPYAMRQQAINRIIIAAVQAKEFGAAVFDTLTKKLFVVDPGEGYSTESPLQSLFKQINADVVLYPQGESGNHTTKLALSELSATCIAIQDVVPIAKDKFTLEGHRIARLISQDTELVFHIDQEYINSHKASVACAGAMLGYLEEAEKIDVAGISINPLTLKCFMKVNPDTLSYIPEIARAAELAAQIDW
ncbi:hypothetical protein LPJ55_000910 [Coemansia sp. RSA 990]|nr:hypothetical protein LPJ55_000910 [Coemansia sp. RSA 990]